MHTFGSKSKNTGLYSKEKKSLTYSIFKIATAFQEPFESNSSVIFSTFSLRESDFSICATQEYETLNRSCLKKGNALPFIF